MKTNVPDSSGSAARVKGLVPSLIFVIGCTAPLIEWRTVAQERESLAGERAAQNLKAAAQTQAEQYNIHYGPLSFRVGAGVSASYTDNTFYSQTNRLDDYVITPDVNLTGFMQVSELNTLTFDVDVGYEYFTKNTDLNGDAPLVNPNTALAFNVFLGNFRIRLHELFSYQQTLFINTTPSGQDLLFNFNNTGTFSRWDNLVGANVDWDLDKVIVSVGYDHEDFVSKTAIFDYLTRASELFNGSISYVPGEGTTVGVESLAGVHNYEMETTLDDHWQARVGPFLALKLPESITLRGGGGYDTAQYDSAGSGSDYQTYYAYGRATQETRLFTHSLSAGHEHLLGDNANNLETTYVRYSISSPIVEHVDLGANVAVHFDKEFGGAFLENYTYYTAGLRLGYQFHKNWRTDLGYELIVKNSDLVDRDFYRNRVTLGVTFTF